MFGWVSRCWGGIGVNSQFQKARLRSVIPDAKVPDDEDVCVLINSFKGQNPQINPQTALNMFFSNLEMSQQRSNPLFLLKHLYILDHTVQERIFVNKISSYYYSEFQVFRQGGSIEYNSMREFVATYFTYVKKKAEVFGQLDNAYFGPKKKERQVHISSLGFSQIFLLIDRCFELQSCIDNINECYKNHNKSMDIIQMIFTMLLKSYLFCYTLVSLSAKTLFNKLKKLNRFEAGKFFKFIKYYNNKYTKDLYKFLQNNKEIYEFRIFSYREIIMVEKCYIDYLQNYLRKLENQPLALMGNDVLNFEEQNKIGYLPQEITLSIKQSIQITYVPRKQYQLLPEDPQLQAQFEEYCNFYSDNYESDFQSSKREDYNIQLASSGTDKDFSVVPVKALTTTKKLQFEQTLKESKFDEQIWKQWKNIYSS